MDFEREEGIFSNASAGGYRYLADLLEEMHELRTFYRDIAQAKEKGVTQLTPEYFLTIFDVNTLEETNKMLSTCIYRQTAMSMSVDKALDFFEAFYQAKRADYLERQNEMVMIAAKINAAYEKGDSNGVE